MKNQQTKNINCKKSVKNINNRRKMHQNNKKKLKNRQKFIKKTSKTTDNASKKVKNTSKNIENSRNYGKSHLKTSKTLKILQNYQKA